MARVLLDIVAGHFRSQSTIACLQRNNLRITFVVQPAAAVPSVIGAVLLPATLPPSAPCAALPAVVRAHSAKAKAT